MSRINQLVESLESRPNDPAIVYQGIVYTYGQIDQLRTDWKDTLENESISPGQIVGIKGDYAPNCIALLIALLENKNIVAFVPLAAKEDAPYLDDGQVDLYCDFSSDPNGIWSRTGNGNSKHPLILDLREAQEGGLIIFSSGSSGTPKAILHSTERFLAKFETASKRLTTLTFLVFDHIAGLDTLFYGLCTGSALVLPQNRDARYIAELIQIHKVEVLPTSPSFLRLLSISGAFEEFDLSSLKIVTYGSEPMDQSTLSLMQELLPRAKFIQKYGMSELGSPASKSRDDGSLWLKLGGEGFQTKILDGILWIKSKSAMLGYLNADNPFDDAGWLCTGDAVESDGGWIKILGRKSELIIVGGEKVYPQEIEETLLELEGIKDALVYGEENPLMGKVAVAEVQYVGDLGPKELQKKARKHCRARLEPYKVPVKVTITKDALVNARNKKIRKKV